MTILEALVVPVVIIIGLFWLIVVISDIIVEDNKEYSIVKYYDNFFASSAWALFRKTYYSFCLFGFPLFRWSRTREVTHTIYYGKVMSWKEHYKIEEVKDYGWSR